MADTVRKVKYVYAVVPNRAGQGAKLLDAVARAGIDMFAYTGFPAKGGKAQLDIAAPNTAAVARAAKAAGFRMSAPKKAFLVQGKDRVGAVSSVVGKLAKNGISIVAGDALSAGGGRWGMILWVKPKDYARAAKVLKAR
jgi:hypothetical protein